jgi:nucleoid DNA-binding protein
MDEVYGKYDLIREIAERAQYTQEDVKNILNEFEDLIREIIDDGDIVNYLGLFKIYSKKRRSRSTWDQIHGKYIITPERYIVTIKPAKNLRQNLNNKEKE